MFFFFFFITFHFHKPLHFLSVWAVKPASNNSPSTNEWYEHGSSVWLCLLKPTAVTRAVKTWMEMELLYCIFVAFFNVADKPLKPQKIVSSFGKKIKTYVSLSKRKCLNSKATTKIGRKPFSQVSGRLRFCDGSMLFLSPYSFMYNAQCIYALIEN